MSNVNIIKVELFKVTLFKVTSDPFIKVASDWVSGSSLSEFHDFSGSSPCSGGARPAVY